MHAPSHAPGPYAAEDARLARPLGSNEKSFWWLAEASSLNVSINCHLRRTPGLAALDGERLAEALREVQRCQPLLRARIELVRGEPWFRWSRQVDAIGVHREALPRAGWRTALEAQLRAPLAWNRAPLARVLLWDHAGDGATLTLLLHHAIADGIGGVALLRALLSRAMAPEHALPAFPQSVPLEARLPRRARGLTGGLRRTRALAIMAGRAARHRDPLTMPVRQAAAPHERTYHLAQRSLDAPRTEALTARARAHGTTVHGAIGAAMLMGIYRTAAPGRARAVVFGSPIDVRNKLSPPAAGELGLFLGASHYRGTLAPATRLWQLAADVRRQLAAEVDAGVDLAMLPMMDLFYESLGGHRATAEEFGRRWAQRNGTTGLTNVGRLDFPVPDGLDIERVHVAAFPSGLDVFNAGASAWAGSLNLNFNWPEPCLDEPGATALIDTIMALLGEALTGDPALG